MSKLRNLVKNRKRSPRRVRTVLAEIVAHSDGADEVEVRIPPAYHAALGLPKGHDGVVTACKRNLASNSKSPNCHDFAGRPGGTVKGKMKPDMPCNPGDWLRLENLQQDGNNRFSSNWLSVGTKNPDGDKQLVDGLVRFAPIRTSHDEIDPDSTRWRASVADLAGAIPVALDAGEISDRLVNLLEDADHGQSEAILRIHDKSNGTVVSSFISRHWDKESESLEPAAAAVERAVSATLAAESIDEAVEILRGEDMDLVLEAVPVTSFLAGGYLGNEVSKAIKAGGGKERYGPNFGNIALLKDETHFGWSPGAVLCQTMSGDGDRPPITIAISTAMQNSIGLPVDAFDSPNTSGARKAYLAAAATNDTTESRGPAAEEAQDNTPAAPAEMNAVEEMVDAALEDEQEAEQQASSTAPPAPVPM